MKLNKNIKKPLQQLKYYRFSKLIFSAGMPRSGSTLLYNILRLILEEQYGDDLTHGWVEDLKTIPGKKVFLIKTHSLDLHDRRRASKIFYTFRDIRDVMVSRWKKFDKEPGMDMVRYYIRQYQFAKKHADMVIQYEAFTEHIPDYIRQIAQTLNYPVDVDTITNKLPDIKTNAPNQYDSGKSLLHGNHATGTKKEEWKELLPESLQQQIHKEFDWWLKENNYPF